MFGPFNLFGSRPSPPTIASQTDNNSVDKASKPQTEPADSLKNRFPAMRALASSIRGLTAGLSSVGNCFASAATNIKWTLYNCAASVFKKDQMYYSSSSIRGTNTFASNKPVSIPSSGSFKAGADLRSQLTESLFDAVVSEANSLGRSEPKGGDQFAKDLYRCTSMRIEDERGNGSIIGGQPNIPPSTIIRRNSTGGTVSVGDEMLANAMAKLTPFVGGNKGYPLAQAIFCTANQTMGNTCGYLLKSHLDPSLSVDTAIGFPTPSQEMGYNLSYDLKRVTPDTAQYPTTEPGIDESALVYSNPPDHFILTMTLDGITDKFMLNQPEPGNQADPIQLNKKIAYKDVFSLKITPNKSFNSNEPQTKENFPYSLEVLEFTSTYATPQAQAELSDPIDPRASKDSGATTLESRSRSYTAGSDSSVSSVFTDVSSVSGDSKKEPGGTMPPKIQSEFENQLNNPDKKVLEFAYTDQAVGTEADAPIVSFQFFRDLLSPISRYLLKDEDGTTTPLYQDRDRDSSVDHGEDHTERNAASNKFIDFIGDKDQALEVSRVANQACLGTLLSAMNTADGPFRLDNQGGTPSRGNPTYTISKPQKGKVVAHVEFRDKPKFFSPFAPPGTTKVPIFLDSEKSYANIDYDMTFTFDPPDSKGPPRISVSPISYDYHFEKSAKQD
ncbi:MAG: hypothetical protein K2W97_00605 [Chthoniobacterales bacterium]|nr:hypothetical protein [Chthoniobacterales bacterium]